MLTSQDYHWRPPGLLCSCKHIQTNLKKYNKADLRWVWAPSPYGDVGALISTVTFLSVSHSFAEPHFREPVWSSWTLHWGRLLRVPWTTRSNQAILKEISPKYSLEGLILKLKLQYFGHLMQKNWFIGKDPDAGKDRRQEEKGMIEDEMVGWHHRLDGHEFEWTPGVGDGQAGLMCCNSWG